MIYLSADHGGFELKCQLLRHLEFRGFEVEDVGNLNYDEQDDYPDYAVKAVAKVLEDPDGNRAILACRTGVGEVIIANRFKNIRATLSWTKEHAKIAREKNDSNVLSLPADYLNIQEAQEIVDTWLATGFTHEDRHMRRLKKVDSYGDKPPKKETINKLT